MSKFEQYSYISTFDQILKDKIMESVKDRKLDVCHLLGIRSQKRSLTKKEKERYKELMGVDKKDEDGEMRLLLSSMRDVEIINEKDELKVRLDGWNVDLGIAISKQFPEVSIVVSNFDEYICMDDDYGCYDEDDETVYVEIGSNKTYEDYNYVIVDGEIVSGDAYDKGMCAAHIGLYERAIQILMPLAVNGNNEAMCNVGVCYEKMKQYTEASKWYERSSNATSKINLLKLFDNKYIQFDQASYEKACNALLDLNDYRGYIYLSYMYQGYYKGLNDGKKALEFVHKAIERFGGNDQLTFEEAYVLDCYATTKEEYIKSHSLYKRLIDKNTGFGITAKYNYALQCRYGHGCKKDVGMAIYWLIKAINYDYRDAYTELIDIYENEDGYQSPASVIAWKKLLEEQKTDIREDY